jgi:hypothetical protein
MQERRQLETIAGRVNLDGSIAAGDGFTVQKGAVGVYTITFAPGFRPVALTASDAGGSVTAYSGVWSGNAVTVSSWVGTSGAAVDRPFQFIAVGVQQ